MSANDDRQGRLAKIEADITRHRLAYLRATWAGHQGEADWYETLVDEGLRRWDAVNRETATHPQEA